MRAAMAGFAAQRRAAEQLDAGNTIRIPAWNFVYLIWDYLIWTV